MQGQSCDAAYPGVCIPPPPPDLDCPEIGLSNFKARPPVPDVCKAGGQGAQS